VLPRDHSSYFACSRLSVGEDSLLSESSSNIVPITSAIRPCETPIRCVYASASSICGVRRPNGLISSETKLSRLPSRLRMRGIRTKTGPMSISTFRSLW